MQIAVLIKQVPETSNVKMDPDTGTMIRTGTENVINPLDLYAIETALKLKESSGAAVTVITMGPEQARKVLKEALSMGCDKAILLSDRKFAGSDTWATSYVLSRAILDSGPYDLIIAGERATDGDTGQVGPGIAAWLDIPAVTFVSSIESCVFSRLDCSRLIEDGYQKVSVALPALITVVKEIGAVRLPTLKGKIRARSTDIPVLTADSLSAHKPLWGLANSPTKVVKIGKATVARAGKRVTVDDKFTADNAVDSLITFLAGKDLIQKESA